jgi:hypothetical protein
MGSAVQAGVAAQAGYAEKFATYAHLLKPRDRLLAVSVESWGTVHGGLIELLEKWARALRQAGADAVGPPTAAQDTIVRNILQIWKMRLSVALMHGRVDYALRAGLKVQGIRGPPRPSTQANALRVGSPVQRALHLGKSRGGRAVGGGRRWGLKQQACGAAWHRLVGPAICRRIIRLLV